STSATCAEIVSRWVRPYSAMIGAVTTREFAEVVSLPALIRKAGCAASVRMETWLGTRPALRSMPSEPALNNAPRGDTPPGAAPRAVAEHRQPLGGPAVHASGRRVHPRHRYGAPRGTVSHRAGGWAGLRVGQRAGAAQTHARHRRRTPRALRCSHRLGARV